MRSLLNIRLDARERRHRGGLARYVVELGADGQPLPIVVHGREYRYSHDERTRDGHYLWAVFSDAGPVELQLAS